MANTTGYSMTVKRVFEEREGALLRQAVTTSSPDEGDDLAVSDVSDFDRDGGTAVFEPGTASEEEFEYAGIDEDNNLLVDIVRPNTTANHASGTWIQEGEEEAVKRWAEGMPEDEERTIAVLVPHEFWPYLELGPRTEDTAEIIQFDEGETGDLVVTDVPQDPVFNGNYVDPETISQEVATFTMPGEVSVVEGKPRYYIDGIFEIRKVLASVAVAPTGSAIKVAIKRGRSGSTSHLLSTSSPDDRLNIAASANRSIRKQSRMQFTDLKDLDYLIVDVQQVGSTTPGEELVVQIYMRRLSADPNETVDS